jgi:hypothetical protein
MNPTTAKENLQNNLKLFGLNPLEWTLEPSSEDEYMIHSCEDENFMFYGKATGPLQNQIWQSIQLYSL